jgi:UDPglucose 6-dehydrogenase
MNISVIGTGYVGLVTGTCLAEAGHRVTCIDIDKNRIKEISDGKIPFYEHGLKDLLLKNLAKGRLNFTTSYEECCNNDIFIICVGTPSDKEGKANLRSLYLVLESLVANIKRDGFVLIKSTVPIGTNRAVQEYLNKNILHSKLIVSSNPEFLKEGEAIYDFQNPDRIIVGTSCQKAKNIIQEIYSGFKWRQEKILYMSPESAELTKYASNCFLATKISFMNEMAAICEATNANILDVKKGMSMDPRIGNSFLNAGLGYGGSCFPKDILALIETQVNLGMPPSILESTKRINDNQIDLFFKKIVNNMNHLSKKIISIWGLSFKPGSDDIRESVAIKLIKKLAPIVAEINVYDPMAMNNAAIELESLNNLNFKSDQFEVLPESSALIICTEWENFINIDHKNFNLMNEKNIFDGRNILHGIDAEKKGFHYFGIGV